MNPKVRVLIIRFSSIGDIVLTTPVIRCVKQQLNEGNNEVHLITKEQFKPIVKTNPYLDEVIYIEKKVSEVAEKLQNEGYDYIFDLHNNLRSAQVKRLIGTLAFTFKKHNIEKWLYVNFKINRMPKKHIVDRYMDTTKAFGIENDNKGLDYFIAKDEFLDKSSLSEPFSKQYVAIAIGGQHVGKVMPATKIIEICNALPLPVILLGGPEDYEMGKLIEQGSDHEVKNTCGELSLNESASLVKQAEVVISHDTGLMHIAAAFKKPVISIWGATVPEFGMYPYMPGKGSKIIEPKDYRDRPYSKLGDRKWYKPPFRGMEKIDVNEVKRAVEEALDLTKTTEPGA
jgi:ADP-heptose:LPS heptosyltransferase